MKFNETLTEIITADLEVGAVPALMGEPGIGKSSFVEALALNMNTKAFTLSCNLLADKSDLTGARLVPYKNDKGEEDYKQVFYPHETIRAAIDYAEQNPREWPILFLDEINRTGSDTTSALLSLPTERRIGSIPLPKNLRLMVAGNDKGNVVALDDASVSRFSIYHVEPEAQTLIGILGSEINPHVKAVLVKYPNLVFEKAMPSAVFSDGTDDDDDTPATTFEHLMDASEEMLQLTTPRTIDSISRWLNAVSQDKLQEYLQTPVMLGDTESTLLNEVIEAHIGRTMFATHLVSEIAVAINSGTATQAQSLTAPKPNCYTDLKAAGSVTDLENVIASLTDHEKSGSLLYSLFERADNQVLIEQLAQQTSALEPDHNRLLIQLAAQSMLDDGNVEALMRSSAPVADTAKAVLLPFM